MSRPRLLDLFCGAGGAGEGYRRAGFDVTGVDTVDRGYRAGAFVQADALEYLSRYGGGFDAIHASPPCHDHSALVSLSGDDGTGHLLTDTLAALREQPKPWVVENVAGARAEMPGALMLCGTEFGLQSRGVWLARHRLFLSSEFLWGAGGCNCAGRRIGGVYGHSDGPQPFNRRGWSVPSDLGRELMGIDWVTARHALALAIPPAYTEFVGAQLRAACRQVVAA